ncbi:hypothetical protein [Gardnerella vaginalis]|uniref:DUF3987 domain-containing protein n=1 Tax=Gardnerella vaginalis TaxID=2702 RepID=A0ABD4ZEC3_GARVA|nr:hypothetical protein [Gardnerella vaginalis]MDK6695814.1 hypothetical protein [Gardnerella vaginalis]
MSSTPVFDLKPLGVKPFESEREFWDSSSTLKSLYKYAQACSASPHAVLVCSLARVCALVPPTIVIPPFIGGCPATLNFAAITIGEPGGGKGLAMGVAKELIQFPNTVWSGQPASGEAIPGVYVHYEVEDSTGKADNSEGEKRERNRRYLKYSKANAFFDIPEVREFAGNSNRVGSTLVPVLVKLIDGTTKLGCTTKCESNTLQVPEYGYRAAIVVGVQPANIRDITSHDGTGLPQRFLWTDVFDLDAPEVADLPERTAPSEWLPFKAYAFSQYACSMRDLDSLLENGNGLHRYELSYPKGVPESVKQNARKKLRREDDAKHGHSQLLVLKTAAIIALFLQEDKANLLNVTAKNMQQAEWLVRQSLETVKNGLDEYTQTKNAETYRQEYDAKGDEEKEPIIQNVANSIIRKLENNGNEGITLRDIKRAINERRRPAINDALAALKRRKAIQEKDGKYYLTK